jgi:hypothetical protein
VRARPRPADFGISTTMTIWQPWLSETDNNRAVDGCQKDPILWQPWLPESYVDLVVVVPRKTPYSGSQNVMMIW